VVGDVSAYAHANEISAAAIRRAAETIGVVRAGHGGVAPAPPARHQHPLYTDADPLSAVPFAEKVKLLETHRCRRPRPRPARRPGQRQPRCQLEPCRDHPRRRARVRMCARSCA
jgi:hypothetical protein